MKDSMKTCIAPLCKTDLTVWKIIWKPVLLHSVKLTLLYEYVYLCSSHVEVRNEMVSLFETKSVGVFLWLRYAYDSMLLTLNPFKNPFTIDTVCDLNENYVFIMFYIFWSIYKNMNQHRW